MALFWFLLGIAIIFAIARYNESNRLFWVLFLSFVGSYMTASVVQKTLNDTQDKKNLVQVCPTQVSMDAPSLLSFLAGDESIDVRAFYAKPVGKDYAPADKIVSYFSKDVEIHPRIVSNLLKPPWV